MPFDSSRSAILKWFQMTYQKIASDMHECTHHFDYDNINPYHEEGSVWAHTMIVFKLSEILYGSNHFVKWSTLLHDIGKPKAMEINHEHKRKRFIGHEAVSAFMALDILKNVDMSEEDKIHLFKLIAAHGSLFHYIKIDGKIKDDLYPTFEGNKRLLNDLVQQVSADSAGRWTDDTKVDDHDPIFTLNLPEHFAPVIESLTDEVFRGYKPHNLTILVGPPCSRKSSWVDANAGDSVVVSRDALVESVGAKYGFSSYSDAFRFLLKNEDIAQNEVDTVIQKTVETARRSKKDVVIDMTNMSKSSRRKWINAFQKDYNRKAVVFLTGYEDLVECNTVRAKKTGKNITVDILDKMIKNFTLPMYGEGLDSIEFILN